MGCIGAAVANNEGEIVLEQVSSHAWTHKGTVPLEESDHDYRGHGHDKPWEDSTGDGVDSKVLRFLGIHPIPIDDYRAGVVLDKMASS